MTKTIAFAGIIVAIFAVMAFIAVTRLLPVHVTHDDSALSYDSARDLVSDSERIVLARYLGSESYAVPRTNAYDGVVLGEITLVVQRFVSTESVKGNATAGETVYVVREDSESLNEPDGSKSTHDIASVSLTKDDTYMLFLIEIPSRPQYKGKYGDTVWTYVGEPSIAQVQNGSGNLEFKTTEHYKEVWDILPESGAPFTLTRDNLDTLVAVE